MKYRIPIIILILILAAVLFSMLTNQTQQPPDVNTDEIRTQAVSTYASSLTETLAAQPSPFVTPTWTSTPLILTATATPATTTPEASSTPNDCFNLMYVEDVTIPDGTNLKAGETFTKTWLVQNTGGCAWRAGFTFQHFGGDAMRGNTVVLTEAVPTGAKRELSIQLVVPSGINGIIESAWRMADDTGTFFGDTLTVQILVGDVTTPAVTSTP